MKDPVHRLAVDIAAHAMFVEAATGTHEGVDQQIQQALTHVVEAADLLQVFFTRAVMGYLVNVKAAMRTKE